MTNKPFITLDGVVVKNFERCSEDTTIVNVYDSRCISTFKIKLDLSDPRSSHFVLRIWAEVFTTVAKHPHWQRRSETVEVCRCSVSKQAMAADKVRQEITKFLKKYECDSIEPQFDLTNHLQDYTEAYDPTIKPSDIPAQASQ